MNFSLLRLFVNILLLLGLVFSAPVFCQPLPDVVARVGSLEISKYELGRALQRLLPMSVGFHGKVSAEKIAELREKALQQLILQGMKVQYAVAHEISVPNEQLEKQFAQIRGRFDSEEKFTEALGGETAAAFRASLYRKLLAEQAEKVRVQDRVQITEQSVLQHYQENRAMYKRPRQYRAQQILVKVDPSLRAEERQKLLAKAQDLLRRAKQGEDFYNLAYFNSDDRTRYVGGDTGLFHSGQVVKEFEEAIKDLKPGEIVGPVKTLYGYHVIKLNEVDEPRQLSYEEVADKIRQRLEKQQRDALYQEWLTELQASYPVEKFVE